MVNQTVAAAPGTGTITLGGPVTAEGVLYLTLTQAGAVNGDVTSYRIADGAAWELSRGTVGTGGTTLTRGLVKSSTGSLINVTATATIVVVPHSEDWTDSVSSGLTATGVDGPSALVLTSAINEIVAGAAGTGVRLPFFMKTPGEKCQIIGYGTENLLIYPRPGQTIHYGGVANGIDEPWPIFPGSAALLRTVTTTKVYVVSTT
jgi:hypothetical protein